MKWYLATLDVYTNNKISNQIKSNFDFDPIHYTKEYYDRLWFAHHNLWKTYNTPAGQLLVDGVLMVTMPALALGRRAKKAIEITRHLSEYID